MNENSAWERESPAETDNGFSRIISELSRAKTAAARTLENLPFHCQIISPQEMEQIFSVQNLINEFVTQYQNTVKLLDSNKEKARQYLEQLESQLDSLPLWQYKFSTSIEDGDSLSVNYKEDSIYYVTSQQLSLRIKKVNLKYGLNYEDIRQRRPGVVQSIMEKIFYTDKNKISLCPKVGYQVNEYLTKDFYDVMRLRQLPAQSYHSSLRQYEQAGQVVAVPKPEDLFASHEGHLINKIYWEK